MLQTSGLRFLSYLFLVNCGFKVYEDKFENHLVLQILSNYTVVQGVCLYIILWAYKMFYAFKESKKKR